MAYYKPIEELDTYCECGKKICEIAALRCLNVFNVKACYCPGKYDPLLQIEKVKKNTARNESAIRCDECGEMFGGFHGHSCGLDVIQLPDSLPPQSRTAAERILEEWDREMQEHTHPFEKGL